MAPRPGRGWQTPARLRRCTIAKDFCDPKPACRHCREVAAPRQCRRARSRTASRQSPMHDDESTLSTIPDPPGHATTQAQGPAADILHQVRRVQVMQGLFRKLEPVRTGRFTLRESIGASSMGESATPSSTLPARQMSASNYLCAQGRGVEFKSGHGELARKGEARILPHFGKMTSRPTRLGEDLRGCLSLQSAAAMHSPRWARGSFFAFAFSIQRVNSRSGSYTWATRTAIPKS